MLVMSVAKLGLHVEQRWPEAQVRKRHDIGHIIPPGKLCSLHQMDHYWEYATLWKKTTRYLYEQRLYW